MNPILADMKDSEIRVYAERARQLYKRARQDGDNTLAQVAVDLADVYTREMNRRFHEEELNIFYLSLEESA